MFHSKRNYYNQDKLYVLKKFIFRKKNFFLNSVLWLPSELLMAINIKGTGSKFVDSPIRPGSHLFLNLVCRD